MVNRDILILNLALKSIPIICYSLQTASSKTEGPSDVLTQNQDHKLNLLGKHICFRCTYFQLAPFHINCHKFI
jgi:hypothetical protein